MMRSWMRLAMSCAAVVVAMSVSPACDLTKSGADVCDDFCNYRCGLQNSSESGLSQNITIWRLTPDNVTGLRNKNTGDAPGDISYFIEKISLTKTCRQDPSHIGCFNEFGTALYGEFTVEIDGQFGPYQMCNPTGEGGSSQKPDYKDSQNFQCGQMCMHPTEEGGCSVPSYYKKNGSSRWGTGGVNCWCDGTKREEKTVGRQPKADSSTSRMSWRSFGGYWFSTPMVSECPEGAPLGTNGCTWRVAKEMYANASCVNGKLDDAVEKYGVSCFDTCPTPLNRTGDCYLDCYESVLKGSSTLKAMPDDQIIAPWVNAFHGGGCPSVKPAPCLGKQCEPSARLGYFTGTASIVV